MKQIHITAIKVRTKRVNLALSWAALLALIAPLSGNACTVVCNEEPAVKKICGCEPLHWGACPVPPNTRPPSREERRLKQQARERFFACKDRVLERLRTDEFFASCSKSKGGSPTVQPPKASANSIATDQATTKTFSEFQWGESAR